jgi:hypothetical protein
MALKVAGHSYGEIARELGWSYTQARARAGSEVTRRGR